MRISKWGNSLAVRIPASVVKALGLREGDNVEIQVTEEKVFALSKKPSPKELLEGIRRFRGRLPADFHFDRQEIVRERED